METFKVELNPLEKQSKYQPYLFASLGVIYTILGFLRLNNNENNLGSWIFIVTGIGFIISSYFSKKYSSKYFFELNDKFIEGQSNSFKKIKIDLDKIKNIHIKPVSIEFELSDNTKEEISIANTTYKNVIKIKTKLLELAAKEKNIEIK